ncbi:hypothetical protein YC2023_062193 [Brassica napus]
MQDIKSIYQQNNYQSQILHTISRQINEIDIKINNNETNKQDQHPFSSITPPIFKPMNMQVKLPDNPILMSIAARLDKLDRGKNINIIDEGDNDSTSTIITEDELIINRIKNNKSTKPYNKRHTPPDLLFEEHHKYSANMYSGDGIYEWNIDGRSEYEIMNLLQEMGMAAMAYKAKGNDDKQSCVLLVVGFNGALRYWWDNSLDSVTRESIINHTETRTIENTEGELEQVETQNAVEVLIHTITMHFMGNPKEELESKKIILTNLRCPTLGDFKWYKDVFVTNIFQRNDCTQAFWKERFIAGLPTYFAERVTNKLKEYSGGQSIPWNSITYGQLFAFIKKEGLAICQEHKDKRRNEKFQFKTNMRSFCEQYGYNQLNLPSRIKRIKYKNNQGKYRRYYKKYNNQNKFNKKPNDQYYSKNKKSYKPNDKQKIVCWNCKRPGHKSSECKMKRKINEIFQDQPHIQEKLMKLLISESESSNESSNETS